MEEVVVKKRGDVVKVVQLQNCYYDFSWGTCCCASPTARLITNCSGWSARSRWPLVTVVVSGRHQKNRPEPTPVGDYLLFVPGPFDEELAATRWVGSKHRLSIQTIHTAAHKSALFSHSLEDAGEK